MKFAARKAVTVALVVLWSVSCSARAAAPELGIAPPPRPLARAPAPRMPDAIATRATPVSLDVEDRAKARVLSAFAVEAEHPLWGGLSGVGIAPDGGSALFLSDRGALFRARLDRSDGRLTGLSDLRALPIRNPAGAAVASARHDAEALALRADGALAIAFETDNRIWLYPEIGGPAQPVALSEAMRALPVNAGIEALAFKADGSLIALAETLDASGAARLFRRAPDATGWTEEAVALAGPHLPTGADIGPDGDLWVTRRDFALFTGFTGRLSRLSRDASGAWVETIILRFDRMPRDNIESVALWRASDGGLRALLVADDNFSPIQRTLVAEFEIAP